ncbi:MAG: hypothetical protein ACRYG7_19135 [Janthinobacterium lividum]
MEKLYLFIALLLAVLPATAQSSLAAARSDWPLATQATPSVAAQTPLTAASDTVAAIHRLFAKRRLRRSLIASGLGAGALVGAVSSGASGGGSNSHGSSGYGGFGGAGVRFDGADYLLLYAIVAAPLILLDFVVYANYSRKREAWVVEEFQAHRLPAKLRHKLKPRYFR